MGLFEKKFCDICGDKVNMLTQQKLSDGYLCSDCKHKLGSFTSGWKQRTVDDVKRHLELREQNKQKYQQFNCSATAGGSNSSIQVDFSNRWFIFAISNRDYKSGNPQVFDFSQLQDFWLEQEYRTLTDSDHDGIPDNRDNFDNRQLNNQNNGFNNFMNGMNQMFGNMQTGMVNVPLSAQPFVRNADSGYSSSGSIKEVSGIKACFRVTDPYITNEISFTVEYVSSNNQMELMQAYETGVQIMQLCQQIQQGGMQNMNNGYGQQMNNGYGQPIQQGYVQQNFQQPMQQNGYAQQPMQQNGYAQQLMNQGYGQPMQQNGYAQQPIQQGYVQQQQPVQNGAWFCPNCGTQNTSKFCSGCGTPKQ
ncbi:MAG: DUF4428 domain-containing protein [Oscillospiraceae bacterium]|nr:DUF4428 domain-containing protein [Oscillospiraceae bacterium]